VLAEKLVVSTKASQTKAERSAALGYAGFKRGTGVSSISSFTDKRRKSRLIANCQNGGEATLAAGDFSHTKILMDPSACRGDAFAEIRIDASKSGLSAPSFGEARAEYSREFMMCDDDFAKRRRAQDMNDSSGRQHSR
jgi:hypothetical protein